MQSLNVQLSKNEFDQLGLKTNTVSFSELMDIIDKRINRKALAKSVELAEKYGLSELSMADINVEIKAYRDAQSNS